ncbi:MAG TPA: hypothetical protein DEB39_16655 [Planctomycetaceae bacterium]|nr:hypothetical protein [Planctomycetaceae bacterium]
MKNLRSILAILIVLVVGAWYGGVRIYTVFYKEPRAGLQQRIDEANRRIERGTHSIGLMRQTIAADAPLYQRSLPLTPTAARSLYQFWLLEVLDFCDLDNPAVQSSEPVKSRFAYQYRFQVRSRGTLDRIDRFLYEFYWAVFLHRIVSMSLTPVENSEQLDMVLTIEAVAIPPATPGDPFPPADRLPGGYFRRLASDRFEAYRLIAERNLMRSARGGVDKADYTYLTSIQQIDGETVVWLTERTTDTIVKAKIGDRIDAGSFRGVLIHVGERDVVFERGGLLWLLTVGDGLHQAFAIPPEARPQQR